MRQHCSYRVPKFYRIAITVQVLLVALAKRFIPDGDILWLSTGFAILDLTFYLRSLGWDTIQYVIFWAIALYAFTIYFNPLVDQLLKIIT